MKKIIIEKIGTVYLKKSLKAKNLCISQCGEEAFKISVPYWVSFKKAEDHILKDFRWIEKFSNKIKKEKENFNKIISGVGKNNKTYKHIEQRVGELAESYGYKYKSLSIKSYRTQWGSCTFCNEIKLNGKIIYLPDLLIDYVILHELVHTQIKGHKKDFWREMNKIFVNAKKIDKELKIFRLDFL